ncbi:hypothetical protein HZS_3566 [Henneguya salminicola]|nr:hypothetical protein HZS_3566 [Henneguya salminicola]
MVGKIDEFIEDSEKWTTYFERFKNVAVLNGISEERQTRALLSVAGPKIFGMVKALLNGEHPTTESIKPIQDLVSNHFCPKP